MYHADRASPGHLQATDASFPSPTVFSTVPMVDAPDVPQATTSIRTPSVFSEHRILVSLASLFRPEGSVSDARTTIDFTKEPAITLTPAESETDITRTRRMV